jgi:oxygen-dependent protoporphyrinogen oxidase
MTDASGPRIAVIGGGIAGLAAAHRLVELSRERNVPIRLALLEAGRRLGGTIATECTDGFVIEAGADSFLTEKPEVLRLCERIGATARLIGTREEFRRTYIVRGNRLHALPEGFMLLAPTRMWPFLATSAFSWAGKLRMALELFLPRGGGGSDESLAAFVTRRFGREALQRAAQPLVGGIYTADPERLSLAATMPRFLVMEREQRSLILAMWRQQRRAAGGSVSGARWSLFASFDSGMQTLVDLVARRLPEGVVRLGSRIEAIERVEGSWRLGGETYDAVILATPAYVSGELLSRVATPLSEDLRAIPYASSATVTLAYRRDEIPHPLDGFGFVVPAIENRSILACTFSSLKYEGRAPAGMALLRAFVGGALQPHQLERDDASMTAAVRADLGDLLGVTAEPILVRVRRHDRSMPQYELGHASRIERIRSAIKDLPKLWLAGAGYDGVGIPDCVRSGETAAEASLIGAATHPR